jgi:hypothetical protein
MINHKPLIWLTHNILRQHFKTIPDKVQIFYTLADREKDHRIDFCLPSVDFIAADRGIRNIWFADLTYFNLNGITNRTVKHGEQKI